MKRTMLSVCVLALVATSAQAADSAWLAGDFHQHTLYTDGSTSFDFVMQKNYEYGLDWWANSEHGGSRDRNGFGLKWADDDVYALNPIIGDLYPTHMARWQSLRDFVWPDILRWRIALPDSRIFSGVEWNVPNHEHCSVAIVDANAAAVSAFEYMFDKSDKDMSREGEITEFGILTKQNSTNEDSIAACEWMQAQYDAGTIDNAWIVFAHIERKGPWDTENGKYGYNVENFRAYNDIAPDICFGFEGIPGHQPSSSRGGFGSGAFGGTYGGAGYYSAVVGGLWDSLLGEGRHFFNYASSDYHSHGGDFYPGEYQKIWACVVDENEDGDYNLNEIANALRSGNVYNVMGDLINVLEFTAAQGDTVVAMGSDMQAQAGAVTLTIKFASPETNNNGDVPVVDHIDLIAGEITGKIASDDPDYITKNTNESTAVIATFTAADWTTDADGLNVITIDVPADKDMYYRLRGTNVPVNTPFQTDEAGNPLADSEAKDNLGLSGAAECWADMWFYGNPIFVYAN